ncbi:MAG: IgGFc-binding protein, partial [Bacteroidota bacterium]
MKRLFWLGIWSCWSLTLFAQTNEGTDFWMGFMQHINTGQNSKILMITAKATTTGQVEEPLLGYREFFTVEANSVTLISLPQSTETVGSENISRTGIHITSESPVSVYAHQYFQLRSEAAMILPTPSLGQHYFAMCYQGYSDPRNGEDYPSEFLAVAVEDETVLTIQVADETLGGRSAGTTFTVTLDQGESYQVQGNGGSGVDLSGSEIVGDKPFAFFAGARWTQVPSTCFARDNLYEQMYPVETWGKRFILAKNPRVEFDLVRLIAAEDNTVIYRNNSVFTTLNRGDITSFNLSSSSMYLESTKGLLIAQFNV